MKIDRKQKIIYSVSVISLTLIITILVFWGNWLDKRRRNAEIIQNAIMNSQTLEPEKFLNTIDASFKNLTKNRKKSILKDHKLLKKYVAEATCKELDKSFKMLFCLPKPVRKKVIKKTAEHLLNLARTKPGEVTNTFRSTAGHGALSGASRFFLLNLSGKEKAEAAPLTAAMYEIVRQQSKGIKLKKR